MLATAPKPNDENANTRNPRWSYDKDLPPPPPLRKSRKHRPAPLDLTPAAPHPRQHLSPLDSNNPNAIEEYLFSPSSSHSNLGMPSPVHYSQNDLLNILNSNPPLTPVEPLRTAPLKMEVRDTEGETLGLGVQLSPGLPPASHSVGAAGTDVVDEIFVELVSTEESFLAELETMEGIIREILVPLGVVGQDWTEAVVNLKNLHAEFVTHLSKEDRNGITRETLKDILGWPDVSQMSYRNYVSAFRLGLDGLFAASAKDTHVARLTEIKQQIVPEGSEAVTLDYLFKRPLVRLRYYSKLYKYWTHFPPQIVDGESVQGSDSHVRDELSRGHDLFKILVSTARARVSEEKTRIQSEPLVRSTSQQPLNEPIPADLETLLSGVDCSRCRELTTTNTKRFPLTDFLSSNPGEPVFWQDLFTTLPDDQSPSPPRQSSRLIILPKHFILLSLTTSPSPPTAALSSPPSTKYLIFPPVFGAALNIFHPTDSTLEIILGGGAKIQIDSTNELSSALHDLRTRSLCDEGGRSPRPEFLTSPPLPAVGGGGGMKRSPALQGWTLTDSASKPGDLSRGWSFETRPRANTEPVQSETAGRRREESVSLVRGALRGEISRSTSPEIEQEPEREEEGQEEERLPPPKMGSLRRDTSPTRRLKGLQKDNLSPNYSSPTTTLNRSPSLPKEPPSQPPPPIPRSPSLPREPTFQSLPPTISPSPSLPKDTPPISRLPRSPSLPRDPTFYQQQLPPPPPVSRSPQPRSLSPSRSVPVQLKDLPHFPATPSKHDAGTPPMLPVLEFGQSPLGMRGYLAGRAPSPHRRTPLDNGSPLAKDRHGRLNASTSSTNLTSHSPQLAAAAAGVPRTTSPATLTPSFEGRVSPSPTVCTFPPRTMRLDESERLAGTRSVDDLRRISSPRQGALSRLEHRKSGSSGGSASIDDEDLSSLAPPSVGTTGLPVGKLLHSGGCMVYFWKKGGWHRPEVRSEESWITLELFSKSRNTSHRSGAKVFLRVVDPDPSLPGGGTVVVHHEILATASIRRDSPAEVSIGCDIPSGKKEYYMFAFQDVGEADAVYHALNTGRSLVGGVSEEQLRQATSLFARTTSFASSLATNSSVGSTISNLSLYDTPPLPSIPAEYSPVEEMYPVQTIKLEERMLVHDHKVKIFLRQEAGIWKNLGNGKVSVLTTGPEVRVHVVQPTKKDPSAVLVDGRIFESGACERVGRTGVAVNLPSREGKISVYMLQSKNDREAQVVYEAIRKGRSAL